MLTDSHLHLFRQEFDADRPAVLQRAQRAGVGRFLNVGYDLVSSRLAVQLAGSDSRFFATVGVHPHDASLIADPAGRLIESGAELLAELETLAASPRVVAVGEIGLDFFRDLSPRPAQRTALELQLDLADRLGLPVVFHIRDAYPQTQEVVDAVGCPRAGGVLHAFAGGAEAARWAGDRGLFLGIGGPVTYKNSVLPAVLRDCPLAGLLLETDAPWLPPVPYRGKRNEPAHVELVARKVADVLDLPVTEVAERTERNFDRLFSRTVGSGEQGRELDP